LVATTKARRTRVAERRAGNVPDGRWERGVTRRRFIRHGAGIAALAGLGAGGLVGCAGDRDEGAAEGAQQEQVEIEYWHINSETDGGATIKEMVREFNVANPNITVRERYQGGDYPELLEKVQAAQAAGEPPGVAQIGYSQLDYVAQNFRLAPVDELAAEYGGEEFLNNFPDNLLGLGRADGRQVGVPYVLSLALAYYNADLLSEAGLDPDNLPRTWDEWERAARTIRDELSMPGLCFRVNPGNTWFAQTMIECNGGRLLGCEDGQAAAAFDSPEAVEATKFWADSVDEGLVLNVLEEQGDQAFLSGELPVLLHSISALGSLREQASFDLRATTFPQFDGRKLRLPGGGNALLVFSEDSAEREAAWKFVQFLLSSENASLWCETTGYLPTRRGVEVQEDAIRDVAVDQLPYTVPWLSFPGPNGFQASQVLFDAHQAAIGGRGDVEGNLERAAAEVNGMIEGQPCPEGGA